MDRAPTVLTAPSSGRSGSKLPSLRRSSTEAREELAEDQADLDAMRAALADPVNAEPIPWEQVKANLGL